MTAYKGQNKTAVSAKFSAKTSAARAAFMDCDGDVMPVVFEFVGLLPEDLSVPPQVAGKLHGNFVRAHPGGHVFIAVNPGSLLATKMVKEGFGIAGNDSRHVAGVMAAIESLAAPWFDI